MGQPANTVLIFGYWAMLIGAVCLGVGGIDWVSRYFRARNVTEREFLLPSGRRVSLRIPDCAYEPLAYEPAGIPDRVYDQECDVVSLLDRMRPLPEFKVSNN